MLSLPVFAPIITDRANEGTKRPFRPERSDSQNPKNYCRELAAVGRLRSPKHTSMYARVQTSQSGNKRRVIQTKLGEPIDCALTYTVVS
jgi:hypothetical protein